MKTPCVWKEGISDRIRRQDLGRYSGRRSRHSSKMRPFGGRREKRSIDPSSRPFRSNIMGIFFRGFMDCPCSFTPVVLVRSRQLFSDDLKRHGMDRNQCCVEFDLCDTCDGQDANGRLSSVDVGGKFAWKSIQIGQVLSSLEENN